MLNRRIFKQERNTEIADNNIQAEVKLMLFCTNLDPTTTSQGALAIISYTIQNESGTNTDKIDNKLFITSEWYNDNILGAMWPWFAETCSSPAIPSTPMSASSNCQVVSCQNFRSFSRIFSNNLTFLIRRLRCQADEDQRTVQLRSELTAGLGVLHRHQGAGPRQQTLCRGGEWVRDTFYIQTQSGCECKVSKGRKQ